MKIYGYIGDSTESNGFYVIRKTNCFGDFIALQSKTECDYSTSELLIPIEHIEGYCRELESVVKYLKQEIEIKRKANQCKKDL